MVKQVFIVGDSFGLPRYHSDKHAVTMDECWPNMIKKQLSKRNVAVELFFETGLTIDVAEEVLLKKAREGQFVIYAGGLVDFFPRTLTKTISRSQRFKKFRKYSFFFRYYLHRIGFTYTWTHRKKFTSVCKMLGEKTDGMLIEIPVLVDYQVCNNPNADKKITEANNYIIALAKNINWIGLELNGFSKEMDFHPKDGHFNVAGNEKMCKLVLGKLEDIFLK